MRINRRKIMTATKMFLEAIGEDPYREGLLDTPERVARMCSELFEGSMYTNDEIAEKFNKCFSCDSDELVTVTNIPIFSFCEHHLMLMYNMKVHVGYIPNGKVIGLSKVARVAEMCGKRLQLQERIGTDIADVLQKILDTPDIIVVITGEHGCMAARGIKKPGTVTKTAVIRGRFDTNPNLRNEFYNLLKVGD